MHFSYDNINQNFIDAVNDYYYLISRKFPQKSVLILIGDRYALSATERSMLYRGIFHEDECKRRKEKITAFIDDQVLHVDTFNILYTISSYLNGFIIYIGNDNLLRDASEFHGKNIKTELIDKSLILVFTYLLTLKIKQIHFYIDKPIRNSGDLKLKIEKLLFDHQLSGNAIQLDSPDHQLLQASEGLIATSDSVIINKAKLPVYDLSKFVLLYHFNPKFLTLSDLLLNK